MNHDERIRVIAEDMSQTIPKLHRWMLRSDVKGTSTYSPMAAVLKVVKKQGPMSMSAIADALYYSKQNLTKLVDKMVKEGYVERLPDPSDRRVLRVALTTQGRTFLAGRKENIKNRMVEDLSSQRGGSRATFRYVRTGQTHPPHIDWQSKSPGGSP